MWSENGEEKANNLFEIGLSFPLWKFDLGAPQGRHPDKGQTKKEEREKQKRRRGKPPFGWCCLPFPPFGQCCFSLLRWCGAGWPSWGAAPSPLFFSVVLLSPSYFWVVVEHFELRNNETQNKQEPTRKVIPQGERRKQHHPKEEEEEGSTTQEGQPVPHKRKEGESGTTQKGGGEGRGATGTTPTKEVSKFEF